MIYNKVLVLVLFLVSFGVYSQEINQLNDEGERNGVWRKYYPNKKLRYEGEFLNGKEIGAFKFYSISSSEFPMVIKTFSKENDTARVQFFSNKGIIESEGEMVKKERIGQWIYYHKDGKTPMIEENYLNGVLTGEYKLYYKNKQLTKLAHYKDGKLNGNSKQYTDKGTLIEDVNYSDGVLAGEAVYYEINGVIKQKGNYQDDIRVGLWEYYVDGKLSTTKEIKPPIKKDK